MRKDTNMKLDCYVEDIEKRREYNRVVNPTEKLETILFTPIKINEVNDLVTEFLYRENGKEKHLFVNKPVRFFSERQCTVGAEIEMRGAYDGGAEVCFDVKYVCLSAMKKLLSCDKDNNTGIGEEVLLSMMSGKADKISKLLCMYDALEDQSEETDLDGTIGGVARKYADLVLKYTVLKNKYSLKVKKIIEEDISGYKEANSDDKDRILKRMMFYVNNISSYNMALNKYDFEAELTEINNKLPGQEHINRYIINQLKRCRLDPTHKGRSFVIKEKYGEGAEDRIRCIFEHFGYPVKSFSCAGLEDSASITGSSQVYRNSWMGVFGELLVSDIAPVIIIKDVDKSNGKDVPNALQSLLNGEYNNEMLAETVDVSKNWFVFICSDVSKMNMDTSTIDVLELHDYLPEDMLRIAKDVVYRWKKNLQIADERIKIEDSTLKTIALKYTHKNNVNRLKTTIEDILMEAMVSLSEENVVITNENLGEYFGLLKESKYLGDTYVKTITELDKKYLLYRDISVPRSFHDRIEELFAKYEMVTDSKIREDITSQLACLINTVKGEKKNIDFREMELRFDDMVWGRREIKNYILDCVYAWNNKSGNTFTIVLDGKPGIGKTMIADTLATMLEVPIVKIHFNELNNPGEITGIPAAIGDNGPGLLGLITKENCANLRCIVLIDEFDKPPALLGDSMYKPFYNLFDKQSARDEFFECEYDTDGILFICTTNDAKVLPETIRNRCQIISVPAYSVDERVKIAKTHTISNAREYLGMDSEVYFEDDILYYISEMSSVPGMREMERTIMNVLLRINRRYGNKNVVVTKAMIDECVEGTRSKFGFSA